MFNYYEKQVMDWYCELLSDLFVLTSKDILNLKRDWRRKFYELKLLLPDNKQNDDDGMFLDFVKYYNRQNNKMVPMDQFVPSTEWYQKQQNNIVLLLLFHMYH